LRHRLIALPGFLHRAHPPMRLWDFPVPPAEVRGRAEHLGPAGFREASGRPVHPGRPLPGATDPEHRDPAHPTDAARDLIGVLAPQIAHAVDPLRSIATAAPQVHGIQTGVLLTRAGHALPLPGPGAHALLREGRRCSRWPPG
jgi:hypothetical protein